MFLSASRYSLNNSVVSGFISNNIEVEIVDYLDFFSGQENWFVRKTSGLPKRLTKLWLRFYNKRINIEYLRIFNEINPEIVFIYNNQLIQPETLKLFKQRAKIVFFLGDHPLYTPTAYYNLYLLTLADYIIIPDSFWQKQLTQMGLKNTVFDIFGFDSKTYYKVTPTDEDLKKYGSDLIYIGRLSRTSWAYKRLLFLNLFNELNLRAYINTDYYYECWKDYFPALEGKLINHKSYDMRFNNLVYNCSKIGPVETVPSIFNGIHVRAIDMLGAHIFPLFEHTKDFDTVFKGLDIPSIKSYDQGLEMAKHFIRYDEERMSCINRMRKRITDSYSPEKVIKRVLDTLF